MTLYRAAERSGGYFGQGSYWTPSRSFAKRFRLWAAREQDAIERRDMALWVLDVEEPEERILDLRSPGAVLLFDSPSMNKRVAALSDAGYGWVFFYEGASEGNISPQAIYLGSDVLRPSLGEP